MEHKRNRISVLLLVLVLLVSVLGITAYAQEDTAAASQICYIPGDMNRDGSLDSRDAIYTLYASFGYENYPITQDCDFNGDRQTDVEDAIYLLYASMHMPGHALEGSVHLYNTPLWTWSEDHSQAHVSFNCLCGDSVSDAIDAQVTQQTTEASCTASGKVVYTASAEYDGQIYTDEKTVYLSDATGHSIGVPTCSEAAKCENCDYEIPATGHNFVKNQELCVAATCQAAAKEVWECSVCGESKEITVGEPIDHQYLFAGTQELAIGQCQFAQDNTYECKFGCGAVITERTEVYYVHQYVGTTTREATCCAEGETTYTCSSCSDSYTQAIPVNANAHSWVYGESTAVCSYCGAEKAIVAMGSEGLKAEDITASEIVLENSATVTLDEAVLESIQQEQVLLLEIQDVTNAFTNPTDKELSAVYDLNMYVDGQQISEFEGQVTVSLPYTLKEGEDANAIQVYYISDSGQLTVMYGTYAGGYVTFSTNHFSWYGVGEMAPAEICAQFGHQDTVSYTQEPTCEEAGYTIITCNCCGYSELHSDEAMAPTGHRFDEIPGHCSCTEDIYLQQFCLDCGAQQDVYIPAVGHNMLLDEDLSCAATCTAPGKNVYRCCNISYDSAECTDFVCEYTHEEILPQLNHNYEATELTQSCVSGGGTHYTCLNCGDSYTENPTAPLGHRYKVLEWSWNETKTQVSVTLGCENCDWSYTQNAVITRKITAPSCTAPGAVTYTAKAFYNMKPYSVSVDVPMNQLGHTPGEEMLHDDTQHFYKCIRCSEKINAADHTWDAGTVTQEATCTDSGSITYSCSVCNAEKTAAIPATGNHIYENGVCTGCGQAESSCNHIRLYAKSIDLKELGGCEGTIYTNACECGYHGTSWYEVSCNFIYDEPQYEEDAYGFGHFVYHSHCTECGLTITYAEYVAEYNPDDCTATSMDYCKITLGDAVLVDLTYHNSISGGLAPSKHPTVATDKTIDLREYGLCSEVLVVYSCPCGENTAYYSDENLHCNWSYDSELSDEETDVFICDDCGAVRKETRTRIPAQDGSCDVNWQYTNTYYVNDTEVYSSSYTTTFIEHSYSVDRYTLYGDSCEDGIYIWRTCDTCGKTNETYTNYHFLTERETVDLSDANICDSYAILASCPCEQEQKVFYTDYQCRWRPNTYDLAANTATYVCSICDAVKTEKIETFPTEDPCTVTSLSTISLYDKDGNHLVTGYNSHSDIQHNYTTEATPLGESCEDGVEVTRYCQDCGLLRTETIYHHEMFEVYSCDMTDFGFCNDTLIANQCPCGENTFINIYNCQRTYYDSGDNYTTWYCTECETFITRATEIGDSLNACQKNQIVTYTLEKEGKDPIVVTFNSIESHHEYIYTLELEDGSESCSEGYHVYGVCQVCGKVDEYSGWSEDHCTYPIARENLTQDLAQEDKLCGELQLVHYACPCGKETYCQTEWTTGTFCNWDSEFYDEEAQCWVKVCSQCGALWYELYSETPIDGESCLYNQIRQNSFFRDGKELFCFTEENTIVSHLAVCEMEMMGDICSDGYYVYGVCHFCGEELPTYTAWSCDDTYCTKIQHIDHENICGPFIIKTFGCACTPDQYSFNSFPCNFNYLGYDDETGSEIYQCSECGLMYYAHFGNWAAVEDSSCKMQREISYTFIYEGETIGTLSLSEFWYNHMTTFSFDMLGDSCEDGYYLIEGCNLCDYSYTNDELSTDHASYTQSYFDLTEYGLCDAYITHTGCACGKITEWDLQIGCPWEWSGIYDPDTGIEAIYCPDCNTYIYSDALGETGENCIFNGTFYCKILRDDQVLLDMAEQYAALRHDYQVSDAVLMDPDGTCQNGITITNVCRNCGDSYTEECYYHYTYTTAYIDLAEDMDACDGYISYYSCPCGEEGWFNQSFSCYFSNERTWTETVDGIEHHYRESQCADCGLTQLCDRVYSEQQGCSQLYQETCTFIRDGYDDVSYQYQGRDFSHQYEETRELMPGATSCEDGVIVTCVCTACGETYTHESYGHYEIRTRTLDLSTLGACPGYVYQSACICGQYQSYEINHSCTMEWADSGNYTDEAGAKHTWNKYVCSSCGLSRLDNSWTVTPADSCCIYNITSYTYSMGDQEQDPFYNCYIYANHDYQYSYTIHGDSCEDGLDIVAICANCGDSSSWYTEYHDTSLMTDTYPMPQESCGGEITGHFCPCNREHSFDYSLNCSFSHTDSWTEETDGIFHNFNRYVCDQCSMICIDEYWEEPIGNCEYLYHSTKTLFLEDEEIFYGDNCSRCTIHNTTQTYTLLGDTCADGVITTYTCADCGYSYTSTRYSCYADFVQTCSLPEGSCGGSIDIYSCPCGNRSYIEENLNCCFDSCLESESAGDYGWYAYACDSCGTSRQYDWQNEYLDNNLKRVTRTYTYSRKEQDPVIITVTEIVDH